MLEKLLNEFLGGDHTYNTDLNSKIIPDLIDIGVEHYFFFRLRPMEDILKTFTNN